MKATRLLIMLMLLSGGILTVRTQTTLTGPDAVPSPTPPTVLVSSAFVDDANRAFELVVALRDAVAKLEAERGASSMTKSALEGQITALKGQITALEGFIAIKDRKEAVYEEMAKVYERIITITNSMLDRAMAQLNRKRTGWEKFVGALKRIGDIALGIAVGRVVR